MTVKQTTLKLPHSNSPALWAEVLNAWLLTTGSIDIQEMRLRSSRISSSPNTELEITYNTPGGHGYIAVSFEKDATGSADDLANSFLTANPTAIVDVILDSSSVIARELQHDRILMVTHEGFQASCLRTTQLHAADPVATILAGDSGLVTVHLGAGPTPNVVTAVNTSTRTWAVGKTGWISRASGNCAWVGTPSCC